MLSLTGVSPEEGEKLVNPATTIEFTILDDGSGIDISTLIVEVNGTRAIVDLEFKSGFDGPLSEITPDSDNYLVVIDTETDFNVGVVVGVKVQVQTDEGKYFNKTYAFKIVPEEPVLVMLSPLDKETITKPQILFLEFDDIIDGVDASTVNISINELPYIIDGVPEAEPNGLLTDVTTTGTSVAIRIDTIEPLRTGDYKVDYSVADTLGNLLISHYNFSVVQKPITLPSTLQQTGFLGFFQGIRKVSDLGCGDTVLVEWNKPVVRDYTYEPFVLIYENEKRLETFDGLPKYLARPTISSANVRNLQTGKTLSYGARALEALDGIFDLTGMSELEPDFFVVPEAVTVASQALDTDTRIEVDSVMGYPESGLIIVGREVMRYNALSFVDNAFLIPPNGRGLFGSSPGIYLPGDEVKLFLDCQDSNTVIVAATPTYQDGYSSGRAINSTGILVPDFTDNDRKFFQGYDFCGAWRPLPQQTLQGIDDCGSYLGGEVNGMKGFDLYDRMLGREEVLLDQTGEPTILLRKSWDGEKCSCATSRRDHPKSKTCAECFGTTYVGGYEQYCNLRRQDKRVMVSFKEATEDLGLGPAKHFEQEFEPPAWTLPIPAIKDRDIIVRFDFTGDIEFIYEVLNASREKLLYTHFGRQNLTLKRLDKTDIVYTLITDALLNNDFCLTTE
jgi:hypothetical protein